MHILKNNTLLTGILLAGTVLIAGCGNQNDSTDNAELSLFRSKVDSFCTSIAAIDSNINSIDTSSDNYSVALLAELDMLNADFNDFAAYDFPQDYDYLEAVADDAAVYMNEAVDGYHDIFENDYSKDEIDSKSVQVKDKYTRACRRIQIIMTFLNGEIADDVTISG